MANQFKCTHCWENCSENQKFCRYCKDAEGRRKMCQESLENNPVYKCKMCNISNDTKEVINTDTAESVLPKV